MRVTSKSSLDSLKVLVLIKVIPIVRVYHFLEELIFGCVTLLHLIKLSSKLLSGKFLMPNVVNPLSQRNTNHTLKHWIVILRKVPAPLKDTLSLLEPNLLIFHSSVPSIMPSSRNLLPVKAK